MKKFSFSLQTLLDINISLEKQQKNEIAAINNRIRILEEEISRKELEIEEVQNKAKKEIKAHCKVEKIKSLNIYITGLNKKLQATKDLLAEENIKKSKAQEVLKKTMIKRKSLEKLRDRQYVKYLAELKKDEEKAIDDFVTYSYLYG